MTVIKFQAVLDLVYCIILNNINKSENNKGPFFQ